MVYSLRAKRNIVMATNYSVAIPLTGDLSFTQPFTSLAFFYNIQLSVYRKEKHHRCVILRSRKNIMHEQNLSTFIIMQTYTEIWIKYI